MAVLREYTQRQHNPLETQTIATGSLTSFRLPETGLGARLYLAVKGSIMTTLGSGTAVLSELGIRNLISRLTVRLNDGTILYELQGFNTAIPTMLQNGFDPDKIVLSRGYTGTSPYKAPNPNDALVNGETDFLFHIEVPFINNDKDMLGLLLLQNGTTQATVEIQWNPATAADGLNAPIKVAGGATATISGTVSPVLEFFTLPAVDDNTLKQMLAPHLSFMHQWKAEYEAITSTAPLLKKLERGSIYTKLAHKFIVNGVRDSLVVNNLQIKMKSTETPTFIPRDTQLYLQKRNYGFDLPEGLFVHDLDRSYGIEEFGDMRDYIDSRQLTELVTNVNYDTSYSIGADSYVYTIVQKLVPVGM